MASSHSRQSPSIATFFRRPSSSHHHQNHTPNDFEFQESDLYNFNDHLSSSPPTCSTNASKIHKLKSRRSAKVADESRSVPVSIPVSWSTRVQQAEISEGSDEEADSEENSNNGRGESRVAPHEYLARKRGASLSVHEGVGRTLKGRDMSRVRNAVWKRIGFED